MKRAVVVIALWFAVSASSPIPAAAQSVDFSRFTAFVNLGVGFQNDAFYDDTEIGLAGPNFGAGLFLTRDLAVLGRYSGTTVTFQPFEVTQTSGVWAGSIQYWLNNWASVEAGAGYGRWADSDEVSDGAFGLILAFHASVFQRGRHHVRAGVEYAPVFTDFNVHNIGLVVGYQYGR